MTFGGQGAPMDIGHMRAKGLCFRCHKQGHLSKDCPEKKDFRDIRVKDRRSQGGGKRSGSLGFDSSTIAKDLLTVTSYLPTHLNIPTPTLLAFNISRTTSTPVTESQNRYAALSVKECNDTDTDTPLKGSTDGSPARAETKVVNPAGHEAESLSTLRNRGANRYVSSLRGETQPMKAFGEKSPTIVTSISTASAESRLDGAWAKLKYTPCEASSQDEQAALTRGSPIATASTEPRLDGVLENTARKPMTTPKSARAVVRPRMGINRQPPTDSEGMGQTGNSAFAVQAPPIMPPRGGPLMKGEDDPSILPLKGQGRSPEGIQDTKKTATGPEAASAQAVQRGHLVTLIEVPDEDNDMAYQIWLAKDRTLTEVRREAMSDEPARSSTKGNEHSSVPPTKSDPSRWLKPFEVDWMLRAICKARNNNAAQAALFLHKGGETAQEQLYELHDDEPRLPWQRQHQNSE
ncbi:uncharacterized protein ARMOST_03158 [Armillaria ostoyae]|uniref:CCHC-type domain-containing protein n=1 Tax=Armillaria ostoyae TaxID=47428 RepID=A0A284QTS1_ARMOS|nr:uncharacterized protein ARMOST_03158 [Armillaria ostoyae]